MTKRDKSSYIKDLLEKEMNREQKLFEQYKKLQSDEWNKNIVIYIPFIEPGTDLAIKVTFTNGMWLRVYYNKNNEIEWY